MRWFHAIHYRTQSAILLCLLVVMSLTTIGPLSAQQQPPRDAQDRPNVILIMADDMGFECLGCYGGTSYRTPNLDRMATEGIRFDHCYSTPLCTPSRVQIMTGRYNFRNYEHFGYLNPEETTFGHLLQEAGYKTMIVGKWQLNGRYRQLAAPGWDDNRRPLDAGFDECYVWQVADKATERYWGTKLIANGEELQLAEDVYTPDFLVDKMSEFMTQHREEPFFIYYPMLLVHDPFVRTPDSEDPDVRGQAAFADMVEYTDKVVGRIESIVEDLGLAENTIILFTGDNGTHRSLVSQWGDIEVPGGKGTPGDAGTHVALVGSWHGQIPKGTVESRLVDFTDFVPTLLECAGHVPDPELTLDGISFYPALRGEDIPPRPWSVCHYDPQWGRFPAIQFARDERYKVYDDGRFFDVENDFFERSPLSVTDLDESTRQTYSTLNRVLEFMPRLPPESATPGTRYPDR